LFLGGMADWATDAGATETSVGGLDGSRALFIPSAVMQFWTASSGGTQYTDLLDMLDTPITEVVADSSGEFPQIKGPDTSPTETWLMWADGSGDGSGPRRAVMATDLGATVGANKAALLDLTDTVTSLQTLAATSLGIVEYDADSASWPARPSDSRIYMWVGPTAPPVGGGYMQDGRDFWLNPNPAA
jgi:hypothetical protein